MAESSLSLGYADFMRETARYLGYSPTSTDWTAAQLSELQQIVNSGYRQFISPPAINGQVHEWSFLAPVTTLVLTADDFDYDLPDDFGAIIGVFKFAPDTGRPNLQYVNEAQLMEKKAITDTNGYPMMFAIRPKSSTGIAGQRFEALFYPEPDTAYTLHYRYSVNPPKLSDDYPYPLGGMRHAETILQSCLAIAEQRMNDDAGKDTAKFMQMLDASVKYDQVMHAPAFLGYNGDNSNLGGDPIGQSYYVTYNGSL